MRTIIRRATVLTVNPENEILRETDVLVEEGRIAAIGTVVPQPDDTIIDAAGDVLMPGLINAHDHCSMSLFRNYGNDTDLSTWLNEYIWPLEGLLSTEEILVGCKVNLREMLRGGITTFVDMYDAEAALAALVSTVGIRAVLAPGVTDRSVDVKEGLIRDLMRWHGGAEDRIRVMIGPHAVYTCNPDTLRRLQALGEELGISYHVHLAETQKEDADCRAAYGMSPTALLDEVGMLNEHAILAHGIWLDDDDMARIARSGASVVYNPASNMKLASGVLPLAKLRERGINVAIGTDGASSNNTQDLFRDMTLGSFIQKGFSLDPKAAPARTMLRMATIQGARAIGQEADLGSIEVGKKADLILVDFHNVRHTPMPEDIEAALVYSTNSEDVRMTMVDGHILMQDGVFHDGLGDDDALREEANGVWQSLRARGGR